MTLDISDKKIIKTADQLLSKYPLCDHCLGRVFAKIENELTNEDKGKTIRKHLKNHKKTAVQDCWLCSGLIDEIPHFVDLILNALNDYEFDTFLVGSKIDEDILEKEAELLNLAGPEYSEPIKTEINRETGKILEKKLGKEVNFGNPTIMAVIDTSFDLVNLQISSLFVYGRYKKFRRDIPQTKWLCKICWGKGCKRCDYKGKLYDESVEELVAKTFLDAAKGTDESFHGCGREDIDVRMLGNGRPFVLEIINPKKRKVDLPKIMEKINSINRDSIEINNVRFSDRNEVNRLKEAGFRKKYRVTLKGKNPINNEKLKKAVRSLQGKTINQLTPSRVAHRRADMVRQKYIYNCDVESIDGAIAVLTVETESGTYIKELISGDEGRTKPSISEMLGVPCEVTELDVIEVMGE
jgi:tRNA pseudouridine synthase 10